MGLCGIELVMETEDAFGIEFTESEAEQIETVGQLRDSVVAKLQPEVLQPAGDRCPSARKFYRLRRGLVSAFGVPRSAVRPKVDLDRLLPSWRGRLRWQAMGRSVGLTLPACSAGEPNDMLLILVMVLAALALACGLIVHLMAMLAGIAISAIWYLWFSRCRPPRVCHTVGELVNSSCASDIPETEPGAIQQRVFTILVSIIAEQMAVPQETIRPETRFYEDLGF